MNLEFEQIMQDVEGRHFTDQEEQKLLGYAQGVERRLESFRAIEAAETEILDDVCRAVSARFPSTSKRYGANTNERIRRDQMMVLRYAAFAMLLRDPDYMTEKLSVWLRSIMYALCKQDEVLFGYEQLLKAAEVHLPSEDAEQLAPYLKLQIDEFRNRKELPA